MATIRDYKRRLAGLKNAQSSWRPHWQELSNYFLPRHSSWLFERGHNKGDKRNQHIIDTTVREAVVTFQAGMMSGLTSPSRPWFRLTTPDPDMMEYQPVRQWLYVAESRMREWLSKSNLYSVLPSLYGDLGVFATAGMGEFRPTGDINDPNAPPVFVRYPIGSYYVAQNPDLTIDTLYLERDMRVEQLVAKFGRGNVSDNVRAMSDNRHYDQQVRVIYSIEPNRTYTGEHVDNRSLPYTAVWFESSAADEGGLLSHSGFHEFPLMVPRWEADTDDAYGLTCPGIDALGDSKALQLQQKRKAQAIDKHVDPPLQAPESLRGKVISMLPGDVTYFDELQGAKGVRSLYEFNPQIDSIREDIAEIQARIQRAFFTDLFRLVSATAEGDPQRTAYEVAQLKEEKLLMLGPALENMNKGLLKPLVDRTFGMMMRAGMLPPPPPELQGVDLKIEYISILAQAQRMVGLDSVERLVTFVGNAAQFQPSVIDKFDFDQSVDEYAEALGTPPNLIVPDAKVAAIRKARAQAQRLQRMAENAPGMADAAKKLSETDPNGDSALNRVAQAVPNMVAGQ